MRADGGVATSTAANAGLPSGARRLAMLSDGAIIAVPALYLAFLLRFEGDVPPDHLRAMVLAAPILAALRLAAGALAGLDRWSFRMSGLLEGIRLACATALGTLLFVAASAAAAQPLPRSVVALEFFLTSTAMALYRFTPRAVLGWALERRRARRSGARRTLIVGAGNAGDLLLRDLNRSTDHHHSVVGFVDDDPAKAHARIGGKPVLGRLAELPELIERHEISTVMLAIPSLRGERVRELLRLCSRRRTSFKIIPASFAFLDRRISAAMLHDLSPEDLLPRREVAFDPGEIQAPVDGRRVLVTGAAGSIGGEIVRQVLAFGASRVVLVDVNENELYLSSRRLRDEYPNAEIRVEVADIREPLRLRWIGEHHQPQYVFHAAAHKHVPLMEAAPEEAIKNNVFGTLNAARMADACGAERFVFISTDKAVRPVSVMGASKRIGELIVRDLARTSRTRVTAVRFGNVLASAGSVVCLFKQQIERGGPVTVTDPCCTRYFMTISEAVGLVLLAGLGGYGDVCVLDMGEAIRIDDLATGMITMAGHVPGAEIPIVYTGLRPGEKLHEEPLTEDEEKTHVVRNRIKVASSPPPPGDLAERLEELRRLAAAGDRDGIIQAILTLVPSYTPSRPAAPRPERAPVGSVAWPMEVQLAQ